MTPQEMIQSTDNWIEVLKKNLKKIESEFLFKDGSVNLTSLESTYEPESFQKYIKLSRYLRDLEKFRNELKCDIPS